MFFIYYCSLFHKKKDTRNHKKSITELFEKYDQDKNKVLEGDEYSNLLDELFNYVWAEYTVATEYGTGGVSAEVSDDETATKKWIQSLVDPNSDGKIDLKELAEGLDKILDTID